jgi:hypothetical protein
MRAYLHRFDVPGQSGGYARPLNSPGLRDATDGATAVDFSVSGRPSGLLRLFEPLIARSTQKNLDRGFARLKQILETGTAS